jgi:hypothetical protein
LAAALKSYQAGMIIRQKLAAADPSNVEWQIDIVVSSWRIGKFDTTLVPESERRRALTQGLRVLERLERDGLLPPDQRGRLDMFKKALAE